LAIICNNATKDVPNAEMAQPSGTFLTKVCEGPPNKMGRWVEDMHEHAKEKGRHVTPMHAWCASCPGCAKKCAKNCVIMMAQAE